MSVSTSSKDIFISRDTPEPLPYCSYNKQVGYNYIATLELMGLHARIMRWHSEILFQSGPVINASCQLPQYNRNELRCHFSSAQRQFGGRPSAAAAAAAAAALRRVYLPTTREGPGGDEGAERGDLLLEPDAAAGPEPEPEAGAPAPTGWTRERRR